MKAKDYDIEKLKDVVLKSLPDYWDAKKEDVRIIVYHAENFTDLKKDFLVLRCGYDALGKIYFNKTNFTARAAKMGVGEVSDFDNIEDAVEFAVRRSIR